MMFHGLFRTVTLQHSFKLVNVQWRSMCLPKRSCGVSAKNNEPSPLVNPENETLLENLNLMGVDVEMARQRQPGVLRKATTNEKVVAQFLEGKGASNQAIASIISRYPRAITRSVEHLEQRWELWRNIFHTDAEIVTILNRSPESFFRSSDNGNLEKNIKFLASLGLSSKDLYRMLTTAPRIFSNSVELNRQMVEFLENVCAELGGKNPKNFVQVVISRNVYILIRSTKRVKANIDTLKASLNLSHSELLALLQRPGAGILDLSNEYLKKNLNSLQQKLNSLRCRKADVKTLIFTYPVILYIGPNTLSSKLDCLLRGGITMNQILEKPKVLDYSVQNITWRLEELQRVGYDFKKHGISILDSSQKRFLAKIEKRAASPDDKT